MSEPDAFPKYLMKINGNRRFLPFNEAYTIYDSGSARVEFGHYVLNEDFSVRRMTDEDRLRISNAADKHSGNK
jgi:hypothetical protein